MINFNIEDKWASYVCDENDPQLYEHAKLISSIFPLPKDGWMRLIFDGSSLNQYLKNNAFKLPTAFSPLAFSPFSFVAKVDLKDAFMHFDVDELLKMY